MNRIFSLLQLRDNIILMHMDSWFTPFLRMPPRAISKSRDLPLNVILSLQGNKKVDLWSFGALLYYCLTKEVGFKVPALIVSIIS